jgi:hypothetical protein
MENNKKNEFNYVTAKIISIIPPDIKLNQDAIYNLEIQFSDSQNNKWIKSCTLNDLYFFREYIITYIPSIINIPFPQKSILSYLPFIGHKYDERNWDILLENKFLLDDFFSTICKDKEMYKLSEFIKFFSKPVKNRNSINIFFN